MRTAAQAQRHVVRVRFAECLQRQAALDGSDDERLHAFRLACKRLRFAIERLEPQPQGLEPAANVLSALTDELGCAHDCSELAAYAAKCEAPLAVPRLRADRDRCVIRARRLWRHGFLERGEFATLAEYAGFSWSIREPLAR